MNAATIEDRTPAGALRTSLGDLMKYEMLINEQSKIWIFHDRPLPGRIAWLEFDPLTKSVEFIPHDMRHGIIYADVPPVLQAKFSTSHIAYLYLTDGEKVTGFQKLPVQLRKSGEQ